MSESGRSYIRGFLAGQAVAYCERVRTGMSLTAQMSFDHTHLQAVLSIITQEGCNSLVEECGLNRVTVWIYMNGFANTLIQQLPKGDGTPTALEVWTMGKLFGYSDYHVSDFINAHYRQFR